MHRDDRPGAEFLVAAVAAIADPEFQFAFLLEDPDEDGIAEPQADGCEIAFEGGGHAGGGCGGAGGGSVSLRSVLAGMAAADHEEGGDD